MLLQIIFGLVIFLVAALALGYVLRPKREPRLTWMLLPAYEVPDLLVAGGVLVENRGNLPAHEVKISLAYPDGTAHKIRQLQITSDVEYVQQSGGENESFVTLTAQQIDPDQKLIIYFSGPDRLLPRVSVTQGVVSPQKPKS